MSISTPPLEKLLRKDETDAKVIIFEPPFSNDPIKLYSTWIELIKCSLGNGICSSNTKYHIRILTDYFCEVILDDVCGRDITKTIKDLFENPVNVRITLTVTCSIKAFKEKQTSETWIFICS